MPYSTQSSLMQSMAAPRRIQWSCGSRLGMGSDTTKLVLWPVVLSVPALMLVLYRGQSYTLWGL